MALASCLYFKIKNDDESKHSQIIKNKWYLSKQNNQPTAPFTAPLAATLATPAVPLAPNFTPIQATFSAAVLPVLAI